MFPFLVRVGWMGGQQLPLSLAQPAARPSTCPPAPTCCRSSPSCASQFRPIPLSLTPIEVDEDLRTMQSLLIMQRTELKQHSLRCAEAAAPVAADSVAQPAAADAAPAAYGSSVPVVQEDEQATAYPYAASQAALVAQLQAAAQAGKLASPTCAQHQLQQFPQHQYAGYALA